MLFCRGGGIELPIKSYKRGIWKSRQVQKFVESHRYFLECFLPTLQRTPSRGVFQDYLTGTIDPTEFNELFIIWTKEVNEFNPLIKPCDEKTARIEFNSEPYRPIILAVHGWKEQNLEVEKIVDELFTSIGKSKVLMMLK